MEGGPPSVALEWRWVGVGVKKLARLQDGEGRDLWRSNEKGPKFRLVQSLPGDK